MENPCIRSPETANSVEDPPPPAATVATQDHSTSESLGDSLGLRRPMPPLSPLTGAYLLIVVGEPHSEIHKEVILQKIAKAFLSWDVNECHVSLEKELNIIVGQAPAGEEARYGERLIQCATENLVTEILIHPQLNTLHQCLKNLLSSFTKHRHIIHAGYTFAGNGSWILQDGTLSISDLIEALHEPEVLRVLKAYENSVSIDVHCAPEGDWTTERFQKEPVTKLCTIRVNPADVMTSGNPQITAFIDYLSPFLEPTNIQQLLQPTDVVGNIRFTHPTLYVFPGGQGDAALFGINGFNMLIDGGFARKACFWDFARHLDRLDAVLLTRLNNSTVSGISAVLQRKKMNHVYPQIGHFFCNLQDRKIALSPDGDKDKDSLIVNLAEEGHEIVANLRHLALKPHPCYRDGNQIDPVNLYHKVGHGKLDMYVLSPARDSQAVKEFLAKWTTNDSQLFSNTGKKVGGKAFEFPLQNLVSICALLVWQPANPNDTITRLLFPGSTPQHKIFEGLEKLRHLEFLRHPICAASTLVTSLTTETTSRSTSKTRQSRIMENKQYENRSISKSQVKQARSRSEKTPSRDIKFKLDTNKLLEEKKEAETVFEDPLLKLSNKILNKDEQIENIKKEIQKIELSADGEEFKKKVVHRSKYDMRYVKSKVDSRAPSKSVERKKPGVEKKSEGDTSPPVTPKKTLLNGTAIIKKEKPKTEKFKGNKLSSSPSTTPAKSAKEANNRKVVEARLTRSAIKSTTMMKKKEETSPPPSTVLAPPKTDRKTISRRPKAPPSPQKPLATKPYIENLKELKKIEKKSKDMVEAEIIDKTVADLKAGAEIDKTETQEKTIEQIEADDSDVRKQKETDTMAVNKRIKITYSKDSAKHSEKQEDEEAENEELEELEDEEDEYLVITKEESGEERENEGKESDDFESVQKKTHTQYDIEEEGEIKKLLREEEESEKKYRLLEEVDESKKLLHHNEVEENKVNHLDVVDKETLRNINAMPAEDEIQKENEEKINDKETVERVESVYQSERILMKDLGLKEYKDAESLPEEKISNTLETSATTAPTLPEDEKVEDEMTEKEQEKKEDEKRGVEEIQPAEIVKEKYIQEGTKEFKETEDIVQPIPIETIDTEIGLLRNIQSMPKKPREVVKTPDEVADLPMHEEVDPQMYSSGEYTKEFLKKSLEATLEKEENEKCAEDFSTEKAKETSVSGVNEGDIKDLDTSIASKYLNIINELEKSSSSSVKDPVKTPEKKMESLPETNDKLPESSIKTKSDESDHAIFQKEISGKPEIHTEVDENVHFDGSLVEKAEEDILLSKNLKNQVFKEGEDLKKLSSNDVFSNSDPLQENSEKRFFQSESKEILPEKLSPTKASNKNSELLAFLTAERLSSENSVPEISQFPEENNACYITAMEHTRASSASSGQITPTDNEKKFSEKNISSELDKLVANELKQTSIYLDKEGSEKAIPKAGSEKSSGKCTPNDLLKDTSGKSTPQYIREVDINASPMSDVEKPTSFAKEADLKENKFDEDNYVINENVTETISRIKTIADTDKMPDVEEKVEEKNLETIGISETLEKPVSQKYSEMKEGLESGDTSNNVGQTFDFFSKEKEKIIQTDVRDILSSDASLEDGFPSYESGQKSPENSKKEIFHAEVDADDKISRRKSLAEDTKEEVTNLPYYSLNDTLNDEEQRFKSFEKSLKPEISSQVMINSASKSGTGSPEILEESTSGKSSPRSSLQKSFSPPDDRKTLESESGKVSPSYSETCKEEVKNGISENESKMASGKSSPYFDSKKSSEDTEFQTTYKEKPLDESTSQISKKSSPYTPISDHAPNAYDAESEEICDEPLLKSKQVIITHVIDSSKETAEDSQDEVDQLIASKSTLDRIEDNKKLFPQVEESSVIVEHLKTSQKSIPAESSTEVVGVHPDDREALKSSTKTPSASPEISMVSTHLVQSAIDKTDEINKEFLGKKESSSCDMISSKSHQEKSLEKSSPTVSRKLDSICNKTVLESTDEGDSELCSSMIENMGKTLPPSQANISPDLSDQIEDGSDDKEKETKKFKYESFPCQSSREDFPLKDPLERIKLEDEDSSRTTTPDKSQVEKSDSYIPNGIESEGEIEKGTLESERHKKESEILDISSEEEEELKGLGSDEDGDGDGEGGEVDYSFETKSSIKNIETPVSRPSSVSHGGIGKPEKEDLNQLVKIGTKEIEKSENESEHKSEVKRMLVTASSEDGGTETEICIQGGVKTLKEILTEGEESIKKSEGEEFSNLILEARKEYIAQRSRKTSCSSPAGDANETIKTNEKNNEESQSDFGDEEKDSKSLAMETQKKIVFIPSESEKEITKPQSVVLKSKKTIKTTETTQMEEGVMIIIITKITTFKEEQEDGSLKVTTTKEIETKGGKNEGTITTVNTVILTGRNIEDEEEEEKNEEEEVKEEEIAERKLAGELTPPIVRSVSKSQDVPNHGEILGLRSASGGRRTSAPSLTSQEEVIYRKKFGKLEDYRRCSTDVSPIKTTYITTHERSESPTTSFSENFPREREDLKMEYARTFKKDHGFESIIEMGENGEKMERTYFYEADEEPEEIKGDKTRFVQVYRTEEGFERKEPDHAYPESGILKYNEFAQETVSEEKFYVEKMSTEETEPEKFKFVKVSFPTEAGSFIDFAKAVDEHVSARGQHLQQILEKIETKTDEEEQAIGQAEEEIAIQEEDESKKDVIKGWGKPMGLPLPQRQNLNGTCEFPGQNISTTSSLSTPSDNSDSISNWGQPMNLPSPAPPMVQNGVAEPFPLKVRLTKETPKKEKPNLKKLAEGKNSGTNTPSRRSQSPAKQTERRATSTTRNSKPGSNSCIYLDLTYVPHHGNSYYINVEFFKKVRARYYVFSGTEPSKDVYNALLEAKQTWEDKDLEVTIIPTYDTDILGYWVAENEEVLAKHKIDLSPSASRCTINLQDHETSCSAYRLEF